jgi:AraC-like DNA-binding protein
MIQEEKVEIVRVMQDYIKRNIEYQDFCLDKMYERIGYSKRHADRLFIEFLNITPMAYVRKIKLTTCSKEILDTDKRIIDIAIEAGYDSHEGFTRAFETAFKISPKEYRKKPKAIPLFVQYPIKSYYAYLNNKERLEMNNEAMLCMITPVKRKKRKLIILRSTKGYNYWSFCEEMGCDWEGMLNSIPEKIDVAAIVELPRCLYKEGTTHVAAGVEVPYEYSAEIPKGYEIVEIAEGTMMYFQTESFANEEDFGVAISSVFKAIDKYDPSKYGYQYDFDVAPKFNYGASVDMGAKMALPVKMIQEV